MYYPDIDDYINFLFLLLEGFYWRKGNLRKTECSFMG